MVTAQVATNYIFTQTTGTYAPITGGTVIQSQSTTEFGTAAGMDDFIYPLTAGTIPFTFTYDGVGHTGCNVSSNGFITFGATAPTATTYTPISSTTAYAGAISAFGVDARGGYSFTATRTAGSNVLTGVTTFAGIEVGKLIWDATNAAAPTGMPAGTTVTAFDTGAGTVTMSANATTSAAAAIHACLSGELRYETLGSPGSRVFVIQYKNFRRFSTPAAIHANFQIRLYEVDNAIEIHYGPSVTNATNTSQQVGLRGPNNTFATNVNNRLVATGGNWALSANGATNTSTCAFQNATFPANGQVYRWIDPPCTAPAGSLASVFNCGAGTYVSTVTVASIGDAATVDVVSSVYGVIADNVGPGAYPSLATALATPQTFSIVHNGNALCNVSVGTAPGASPCFDNGVCYTPGLTSPDNNCPTGVSGSINITGQPTSLGSTVYVESVDLILTGTFRGDNEIRLVNPNGTSVLLIDKRGSSGDNFGDFASCPAGALKLKDGATAIGTIGATPLTLTGTFAPEAPLAGFHDASDPNGLWQILICDNATGDQQTLRHVQINFVNCLSPSATASAVPNCLVGPPDTYSVAVNVTALGSAANVDITNSISGLSYDNVGVGLYSVGPFPVGTPTSITVVHNGDNACNLSFGPFDATCPPDNDLCANAIPINCNSVVAGNTELATHAGAPTGTCDNTGDAYIFNAGGRGVWYTVQGFSGTMTASLCGSSFDTQLWVGTTADCVNLSCVAGNDDAFALCPSGGSRSIVSWTGSSATTYYIYVTGWGTAFGDYTLTVSCGDNNPLCPQNGLILEFQTDGAPFETTWEILNEAGTVIATSGGPLVAPFGIQTEFGCVTDGCYTLRVLDASGDGMTTGGYILRTQVTNQRIIDNRYNFDDGFVSAISSGQGFCLPMSSDKVIFTSCDKLDWINGQYVVASPNPAVSAEWIPSGANSVQDANSGYEFWIFDPNGSYSFRRFRSHNVSDGFGPASATRACHMKLNNWTPASHVPANVLMNVRVRARINGVNGEFGPACRLMIDPVRAACPLTNLMDVPGSAQFSCNVIRPYGTNNYVFSRPVSGANRYQFRFRIPAEGFEVVRTSTTYILQLNWTGPTALQDGNTYEVDVRVSKDGGLTWCTTSDPWGNICQLTIDNTPANSGNQNFAAEGMDAELRMFPNPNRGDVLNFSLSAIEEGVNTVSVDIYDLTGKRMSARMIAVTDGQLNTTLDLNGELAAGMYVVNIIAGETLYTERLVIQP
jgi:subtilisin-like proprotein convertase family protein